LVHFPGRDGPPNGNRGVPAAPEAPTRRSRHPWRFVIVATGLVVAANLLWFAGHTADTGTHARTLPSEVTGVFPTPGSQVRVQDSVTVGLRPDLIGVLVIDGVELPESQLTRVV